MSFRSRGMDLPDGDSDAGGADEISASHICRAC